MRASYGKFSGVWNQVTKIIVDGLSGKELGIKVEHDTVFDGRLKSIVDLKVTGNKADVESYIRRLEIYLEDGSFQKQ